MSEGFFAPDPTLQQEIDDALRRKLQQRRNPEWTSKRGVVIDPQQPSVPDLSVDLSERTFARSVTVARNNLMSSGFAANIPRINW